MHKYAADHATPPAPPAPPQPPVMPAPPSNSGKPKKYRFGQLLSILLIAFGLFISIGDALIGLVFTVIGCFCLHRRAAQIGTDTRPFYRHRWQIVVAVLYVLLAVAGIMSSPSVSEISADGSMPTKLSIPDAQEISFIYSPNNASISSITCASSNESVASVELKSAEDGKIICLVTPLSAGKTTISCGTSSVSAPDVDLTITDPAAEKAEQERIEAEKAEQERIAAEQAEQERIAAEKAEQERIAAEKAEQERIAAEQAAQEQEAASAGQTVYITPSGDRYHLDPDCGGKNSRPVSINDVGGRTPCKKCAS